MDVNKVFTTWIESKDILRTNVLLSTHGKVLCALMIDPEITQVALSLMLGVAQSMIEKSVGILIDAGIVHVEKIGRHNMYHVNYEYIKTHPEYVTLKEIINNVDKARLTDT